MLAAEALATSERLKHKTLEAEDVTAALEARIYCNGRARVNAKSYEWGHGM